MKNSHFLLLVVAMTAIMCVVDMALIPVFVDPAPTAQVQQNGTTLHSLPLDEDTRVTVDAPNGGSNALQVETGRIRVFHSTCTDQECVMKGWIDEVGDSISCPSNGLTIQLEETNPDAEKSAQ